MSQPGNEDNPDPKLVYPLYPNSNKALEFISKYPNRFLRSFSSRYGKKYIIITDETSVVNTVDKFRRVIEQTPISEEEIERFLIEQL